MLEELRIQNLGVIEELSLVLPSGSIAVTGETGAGKTMVVGAIQLLMGGRAEPDMVRIGASEAVVEGRFVDDDGSEVVARRVLPADGRSRAYLDGALATASGLQERIGPMIDLHGQHSQQSILQRPATQRDALDRFAGIDRAPLRDARADIAAIDAALADLGGDATERARQIDLLRYQLDEVNVAAIASPTEDADLQARESVLANAFDNEVAAGQASDLLGSDGKAADALGEAASILPDGPPFDAVAVRIQSVQEELSDLASELRTIGESITDDPEAVEVTVDGAAGDDVAILLAPNPGLPLLPVGKNASGGELSRTMLALRLVLAGGPPIKVFDEVDAGIGGGTARAVGEALSSLGAAGQVFVVTHLAQVASFAGHHIVIDKSTQRGATASQARILTADERVIEVSRMLSGSPDSAAAHEHAEELLSATSASWGTSA